MLFRARRCSSKRWLRSSCRTEICVSVALRRGRFPFRLRCAYRRIHRITVESCSLLVVMLVPHNAPCFQCKGCSCKILRARTRSLLDPTTALRFGPRLHSLGWRVRLTLFSFSKVAIHPESSTFNISWGSTAPDWLHADACRF